MEVWLEFKEFWNPSEGREIPGFSNNANNVNNVYLNFILAFSLNRYGYYDGEFPVSDLREIIFKNLISQKENNWDANTKFNK